MASGRLRRRPDFPSRHGGTRHDDFPRQVFVSDAAATGDADLILIELPGAGGTWIGSDSFDGTSPQVRFDETDDVVQVDSDGDGAANFSIILSGVTSADQLTATDILFS